MENRRENYINNLEIGRIIAFSLSGRMMTGMVVEIKDEENGKKYTIKTKNNSVYYITASDIVWVKTGSRFPKGIYNALKLGK